METYEQVLEKVELALSKGEYNFCIEFLSPIIKSYPLSSKEGTNLRTILITALCGVNKKEDAKKICQELLKSYEYKTRENAKYLMEIIDSPEIKKPENWNIKFENYASSDKKSLTSLKQKQSNDTENKFINVIDIPTGETKSFQRGFTIIIFIVLLTLIPLLSGCVKIVDTLDLSDINSINNNLKVESKYINKLPWQIKFEDAMQSVFPDAEISKDNSIFSLKIKNLNLENTKKILKTIQYNAGNLAGITTDLKIITYQKNYVFLKKYNYMIDFDLQNITNTEDLEINFKIINPNNAITSNTSLPQIEISKNIIFWHLIPGKMNSLAFSYWSWNKLLIGTIFIFFLVALGYLLRFYRFKIGTDLPQLPSS